MKSEQHVQLPIREIDNLQPKDKLIFLCIKRWDHNGIAKVPISALATQSGASAPTIRKIIKTLVDNNYIEIIPGEKGEMNSYKILAYNKFEKFDYSFLDNNELSFKEKAFMAATKHFLYEDNTLGKTTYTTDELAGKINVSPSTVYRINNQLKRKNMLTEIPTKKVNIETGCKQIEYIYDLGKMGIVPILQAHEEQIEDNTLAIQSLRDENKRKDKVIEQCMKDIEVLKNALFQNNKKESTKITVD